MATQTSTARRYESFVILGVLLTLAVIAWAVVIGQALALRGSSMDSMAGGAPMGLTMGMGVVLFLAIWVAMMVAMMFPSAAPMVLLFSTIAAGKRQRGQAFVPTWIFVAGYLLVWTLAGGAAYLAAVGLDALASQGMWVMEYGGRITGGVLVVAGVYQLSPLKRVCLAKCRTPMQFLMTSWHSGYGGALRMGIEHGVFCLGCCWLLFVVLFPLGMMNIAVLALVTVLIFAEKVLPAGRLAGLAAGIALVGYGVLVVASPTLLPGTMM